MVFSSLRGYRRAWAYPDLLAAAALLVIAVPEQLATSRLAGMPPITGLYAFVAGTAAFAIFGTNRQMSVGADSTIAPLFAVAIGATATIGSPHYVALVGILAVTVGVFVTLVGLLRLGWIAEFLSAPIISGFMAGVAVIIVVHQLPDLLGIASTSGSTARRVASVVRHVGDTNGVTLALGAGVLAIVIAGEIVDRRVPGALIALVATTALVQGFHLHRHGVAILGSIAHDFPRVGLHGLSWTALGSVAPVAGVVALVVISQSAATTRAFSDRGGYSADLNRDFVGVGAGSVAAGLVGAFPVNASPPRTAAVAAASGKTQLAGLLAAGVVAALVPAAGALRDVPEVALAAVLILLAARIFRLRDLVAIARFDAFEFGLAIATLLTVSLVGVEQGIGVAVGLAILDRTRLSARPQLHVLGRIPGTTSWVPLSGGEAAAQVPGVLVVLFATPLWYANTAHFRAEMVTARTRAEGATRLIVLDAIGMSDVDFTGAGALSRTLDDLDRDQVGFAVARAGEHARRSLARSGILDRIGSDRLFASVDEAVTQLSGATATATPAGTDDASPV